MAAELARVPLFSGLAPAAVRRLADRTHSRRLAKGQLLFTEGEPSSHLFVVRSGHLRISVSSPDGENLILTVVMPGESIGEVTVLSGDPRSATVEALEPTELLAVPVEDIRAALLANPEASLALASLLAATVRRLTGTAADLVFLDVPRRLAKLLVTEATEQGDGTLVCELGMSQSGVAARVGTTRQSLNGALGEFAKRGWIETAGTSVRLDDRDATAGCVNHGCCTASLLDTAASPTPTGSAPDGTATRAAVSCHTCARTTSRSKSPSSGRVNA